MIMDDYRWLLMMINDDHMIHGDSPIEHRDLPCQPKLDSLYSFLNCFDSKLGTHQVCQNLMVPRQFPQWNDWNGNSIYSQFWLKHTCWFWFAISKTPPVLPWHRGCLNLDEFQAFVQKARRFASDQSSGIPQTDIDPPAWACHDLGTGRLIPKLHDLLDLCWLCCLWGWIWIWLYYVMVCYGYVMVMLWSISRDFQVPCVAWDPPGGPR